MDNVRKLVEQLTGVNMPEQNDGFYSCRQTSDGFDCRLSGLDWSFKLKGGTLLREGMAESDILGRQLHRAVEFENMVIHYRLCDAMEGSGYDAFAVVQGTLTTPETHNDIVAKAMDTVKVLTNRK